MSVSAGSSPAYPCNLVLNGEPYQAAAVLWGCWQQPGRGASSHRQGLTLESQCLGNMVIKCMWHLKLGQLTVSARIIWSDTVKDKREGSEGRLSPHPSPGPGETLTELVFFHQLILPLSSQYSRGVI